jgi:DNA sulfur modification protein DndC
MSWQPTLFDGERQTMSEAIEQTIESLSVYGPHYNHWALAYSGGKDSSAALTLVVQLIITGKIPKPKSLTVLYADTRMELPPLQNSAMQMLAKLNELEIPGCTIRAQVVLPKMDDRYFVYMLGRGVPPPSNTFRWCTAQMKIEPMMEALADLREQTGEKLLMLTGVRVGESAQRDARISLSCGKDNAECGQGWFQISTPESVADTLAPLLHWRVCLVWKWLRNYAPMNGWPTEMVADAYGGDEAEEVNCRTGCVGCNLASRDVALEELLKNEYWQYLQPLMELRPLWAELKKPHRRLRKTGRELTKAGDLVKNPNRMGPLTMDARRWALDQILSIQDRINAVAEAECKPTVVLIDHEEHAAILRLIDANTWPNKWDGTEARADEVFEEIRRDGSVQDSFLSDLVSKEVRHD